MLAVASREYLKTIKDELEERVLRDGPLYIEVRKDPDLIVEFISILNRGFFLYRPVLDKGDTVVYVVSLPENYIQFDDSVLKYSSYLLDLDIIRTLIRKGKLKEVGEVRNPATLIRYFREWSLAGRKLVLLTSTRTPVKGVVLFVKGKVRGAWVDAVRVYLGRSAVRILMYYGPYKYAVYDV
jgi:hypothetical protein